MIFLDPHLCLFVKLFQVKSLGQLELDCLLNELVRLLLRCKVWADSLGLGEGLKDWEVLLDESIFGCNALSYLLPVKLFLEVGLPLKLLCHRWDIEGVQLLVLAQHSGELAHLLWSGADAIPFSDITTAKVRRNPTVAWSSRVLSQLSLLIELLVDVPVHCWIPDQLVILLLLHQEGAVAVLEGNELVTSAESCFLAPLDPCLCLLSVELSQKATPLATSLYVP